MNTSLKFEEIARILEATIILNYCRNRGEIHTVVGSDLMSDIFSFGERNAILLTGLITPQIIRPTLRSRKITVVPDNPVADRMSRDLVTMYDGEPLLTPHEAYRAFRYHITVPLEAE